MATHNPLQTVSFAAKADYSASQYRLLVADTATAGYAKLASATTAPFIGILQNTPNINEDAAVIRAGIGKVVLGAIGTPGNPITSDANGKGIPATVNNSYVIGTLVTGGVTNDVVAVNIAPSQLGA